MALRSHGRDEHPPGIKTNFISADVINKFLRLASHLFGSPEECWGWPGAKIKGHGVMARRMKNYYVHRISWTHFHGPIPPYMTIDHVCRNEACFNPGPKHLECVTSKVNSLRGTGPAAQNARKTHCKRGHPLSGDNLYEYKGIRNCKKCRAEACKRHRENQNGS